MDDWDAMALNDQIARAAKTISDDLSELGDLVVAVNRLAFAVEHMACAQKEMSMPGAACERCLTPFWAAASYCRACGHYVVRQESGGKKTP